MALMTQVVDDTLVETHYKARYVCQHFKWPALVVPPKLSIHIYIFDLIRILRSHYEVVLNYLNNLSQTFLSNLKSHLSFL